MRLVLPEFPVDAGATPIASRRPLRNASGQAMGTTWTVQWHAPDGSTHPRLAIETELARLVQQMSTWIGDSSIARLNAAPLGDWIDLPEPMAEVVAHALAVARDSDGAFDPTVGALVEAWGFGPPPRAGSATVEPRCDWRAIEFDATRRAARRTDEVRLDLSAIAKGDAVDRVSNAMARLGLRDHLVEIGGELRGAGVKPDWEPWWVGLERPPGNDDGGSRADTVIALHGLSVATSGDYHRHAVRDGRRVSHTIDPRTRQPLEQMLAAVSVVHPSCRHADALSTALLVMGLAAGLRWAAERDIAALFRERTANGLVVHATPTLERWSQSEVQPAAA